MSEIKAKKMNAGSVLERFRELERKHKDGLSIDEILHFVGMENARCLIRAHTDEYMRELHEFSEHLLELAHENKALMDRMEDVWPNQPAIIRVGMCSDAILAARFDPEQKRDFEALRDFIWNMRAKRRLTLVYEWHTYQLLFPKTILKEELEEKKEELAGGMALLVSEANGVILLRVSRPGEKDALYGFYSRHGSLRKFEPETLRQCYENMANREEDTDVEYLSAPFEFEG